MLLERTQFVSVVSAQPAILLEWVSPSSGVFGTEARFRWRTQDITTGHIVIQILRGSTVVYTFPNRTPNNDDWTEETWLRIPPRGEFTVYAYWSDDGSVNASLTGQIVAQPSLTAVWYVNNQPAGTDITVERGTPVFARLVIDGSDQSMFWNENGWPFLYDPPSPPDYWSNYTLDIPVSTTMLGTYNYQAILEDIQRDLRMVVVAWTSGAEIEVEWKGGDIFPYGALAQARWRTRNTDPTEQVELFVVHNNTRTVLGTAAPNTNWQLLNWSVVPPRGSLVLGGKLVLADREAVVVGRIAPNVLFKVELTSSSSFFITDPNGKFTFQIAVNQSEYPVRVYRNDQLIETFTPTGAWWDNVSFSWDDRPTTAGVYTYRLVLENENLEESFTVEVLEDEVRQPNLELEWVGSNSGVFGSYLQYRVRVTDSSAPAQVYYARGSTYELLQTVPNDGQWHVYPFQVRPPRGAFHIEARVEADGLLQIIDGVSQAAPSLEVTPRFPLYLPENYWFEPEFDINIGITDRRLIILRNGEQVAILDPPSPPGYWNNTQTDWWDDHMMGSVGNPIHYQFVLENEGIQRDIWIHFYRQRQSDAVLLERTEFVAEADTPPPQEEPQDTYVRLFFAYKFFGRAVYFHVMAHGVVATYHQRSNASFLISDCRKMQPKRYLVIETGGSRQ